MGKQLGKKHPSALLRDEILLLWQGLAEMRNVTCPPCVEETLHCEKQARKYSSLGCEDWGRAVDYSDEVYLFTLGGLLSDWDSH